MPAVSEHCRRTIAGNGHVEDRQTADGIAMLSCECERYRSAPVVPDDEKLSLTQYIMSQPPDVVRYRLLVVTSHGARAVAETPQIGCYHPVAMCKSTHDVAPHVPCLWPAVDKDDGRTLTRRDIVDSHIAEIGEIMLEVGGHWRPPSGGRGLASFDERTRAFCHRPCDPQDGMQGPVHRAGRSGLSFGPARLMPTRAIVSPVRNHTRSSCRRQCGTSCSCPTLVASIRAATLTASA